jgi:hypothetical protein
MILIMSYKCRLGKYYEDPKICLAWEKAKTILQHMASFRISAQNTLGFLQRHWAQVLRNSDASRYSSLDSHTASTTPCLGYDQTEIQAPFCKNEHFHPER